MPELKYPGAPKRKHVIILSSISSVIRMPGNARWWYAYASGWRVIRFVDKLSEDFSVSCFNFLTSLVQISIFSRRRAATEEKAFYHWVNSNYTSSIVYRRFRPMLQWMLLQCFDDRPLKVYPCLGEIFLSSWYYHSRFVRSSLSWKLDSLSTIILR